MNTETDSKRRLYQQVDETIDHIISACPILAKEQYIKRHDRVSAQLHFNICKDRGVKLHEKHWYDHLPKSVETSQGGKVTILWNQQVQSDRTIPNNKPDIVIRDNEKRTCMLIDVAISGDRNMIKKEAEKILKYKNLTTEIQHMWNVKTMLFDSLQNTCHSRRHRNRSVSRLWLCVVWLWVPYLRLLDVWTPPIILCRSF